MGMRADVVGFGKFEGRLAEHLGEEYEDMADGAYITIDFFPCNTNEQSRELCKRLGLVSPYDLGNHLIIRDKIDKADLHFMVDKYGVEWDHDEVEQFITLLDAGFVMFYRPNY